MEASAASTAMKATANCAVRIATAITHSAPVSVSSRSVVATSIVAIATTSVITIPTASVIAVTTSPIAVIPRAGANEHAAYEPSRPIVPIGRARVWII